jgi:hypothetical protein
MAARGSVRVLLYSLIVIVVTPDVWAQVEMDGTRRIQPLLNQRFSAALLAANPGAVPESVPAATPPPAQRSEYISWRLDEDTVVSVTYYVSRTAKDAREQLLGMQSTIAVRNVAVEGPGDQAFFDFSQHRWC